METRSIGKFILFSLLTLGIYALVWFFWTSKELRNAGQEVPTAWLQFIPFANIYFYFKYFEAAERATNGGVNGVLYFVLALFISPMIAAWIAQNEYNKIGTPTPVNAAQGMPGQAAPVDPAAPVQPTPPAAPVAPAEPMAPAAPAAPEAPAQPADVATPPTAPEAPATAPDEQQQPPAAPPTA